MNTKLDQYLPDGLGGVGLFPYHLQALLTNPYLKRLCKHSHSATLANSWHRDVEPSCDKWSHSVGLAVNPVAAAAQALRLGPRRTMLQVLAALFHDMATGPFSHTLEKLMEAVCGPGTTHETQVRELAHDSSLERLTDRLGGYGTTAHIIQLLRGLDLPYSKLMNAGHGELDIDSLMGIGHYIRFLRLTQSQQLWRTVHRLADSYRFTAQGQLVFTTNAVPALVQVLKWRQTAYQFLYGPFHLTLAAMILRAAGLLHSAHHLKPSFFHLTDSQAFCRLRSASVPGVRKLAEHIEQRCYYVPVYRQLVALSCLTDQLTQADISMQLPDYIARVLKLEPWQVAFFLEKDAQHKRVSAPLQAPDESLWEFHTVNGNGCKYLLFVCLHPSCVSASTACRVAEAVSDWL